jgi:hypothetical protein
MTSDVCFWHKTDIQLAPRNVRFWGNSEHRLKLAARHSFAQALCVRFIAGLVREHRKRWR